MQFREQLKFFIKSMKKRYIIKNKKGKVLKNKSKEKNLHHNPVVKVFLPMIFKKIILIYFPLI